VSAKPEAKVNEALKPPKRPLVSEIVRDSEPVKDLNKEFALARLEARDSEPVKDLNNEAFSAKTEAIFHELVRDLNREDRLAKPEAIFQVAVRAVEQERGLELQVSTPESTLATMLPIVIVIAATIVLKIELFSSRLEESVREVLRNLNIEVFSVRIEARVRELLSDLNIEDFSTKLEA